MNALSVPVTAVQHRVNGVTLHVMEAGANERPSGDPASRFSGILVGLASPDRAFWQEAGFRVVVPDQRGYHLSDKPRGARAYDLDTLAADVVGLARQSMAHQRF